MTSTSTPQTPQLAQSLNAPNNVLSTHETSLTTLPSTSIASAIAQNESTNERSSNVSNTVTMSATANLSSIQYHVHNLSSMDVCNASALTSSNASNVSSMLLTGQGSGGQGSEPVSLDSLSSSMGGIATTSGGTERTRELALCAVLLDEWLKELAAIAQEQSVVMITSD